MIYPSRRAVLLMAAGVPAALALGVLSPLGWLAGPGWIAVLSILMLADGLMSSRSSDLELADPTRPAPAVGRAARVTFFPYFERGPIPRRMEAALEADDRLDLSGRRQAVVATDGRGAVDFDYRPVRRGDAMMQALWLRWLGPLGLVWKQKIFALDLSTPVRTDIQGVRDEAVRLFARDAQFGVKSQIEIGEGSEFQALSDFQAGMDRRAIDWKQSARHSALKAKEFRTERNHNIIISIDCGRGMSEPVGAAPRLDHAIHAGLLLAYAGLKGGDRVGVFAFDSRPRQASGPVSGLDAFRLLQQAAGRIDYSTEETNYTLGLAALSGELQRRSLVVVFTDFIDSTAAELMLEASGRLLRRHLVLFVILRDAELEAMAEVEPHDPDDVSRAVVAASLLRERETVTARLRRMGAHIVESSVDRLGADVVSAYLDLKRRDLL